MISRVIGLAAGLAGAASFAQFPEFSQQYTQRLGGSVDALSDVVADFDASARSAGLSRDEALAALEGSEFLERRRADMTRTFARFEDLSADLAVLEDAGPFTRAYYAARLTDRDVASAALDVYQPALPVTFEGIIFALLGYLSGQGVARAVTALLSRKKRRAVT